MEITAFLLTNFPFVLDHWLTNSIAMLVVCGVFVWFVILVSNQKTLDRPLDLEKGFLHRSSKNPTDICPGTCWGSSHWRSVHLWGSIILLTILMWQSWHRYVTLNVGPVTGTEIYIPLLGTKNTQSSTDTTKIPSASQGWETFPRFPLSQCRASPKASSGQKPSPSALNCLWKKFVFP